MNDHWLKINEIPPEFTVSNDADIIVYVPKDDFKTPFRIVKVSDYKRIPGATHWQECLGPGFCKETAKDIFQRNSSFKKND